MDVLAPPNCFEHPAWIKRFVDDLEDPQWTFLLQCGLNLRTNILQRCLNVDLLDVVVNHWNPIMNMFFEVREIILLEEDGSVLKIRNDSGSSYPGESRTALLECHINFVQALRPGVSGHFD